jgi:hypothetical protein
LCNAWFPSEAVSFRKSEPSLSDRKLAVQLHQAFASNRLGQREDSGAGVKKLVFGCFLLLALASPSKADSSTVQACVAGVRADNPGKADSDPAIAVGMRCCQQVEMIRQDAEVAKSFSVQTAQCMLLYRNNDDKGGNACIEKLQVAPAGIKLPPATYELAKQMETEALVRQAMTTNALKAGSLCHKQ